MHVNKISPNWKIPKIERKKIISKSKTLKTEPKTGDLSGKGEKNPGKIGDLDVEKKLNSSKEAWENPEHMGSGFSPDIFYVHPVKRGVGCSGYEGSIPTPHTQPIGQNFKSVGIFVRISWHTCCLYPPPPTHKL